MASVELMKFGMELTWMNEEVYQRTKQNQRIKWKQKWKEIFELKSVENYQRRMDLQFEVEQMENIQMFNVEDHLKKAYYKLHQCTYGLFPYGILSLSRQLDFYQNSDTLAFLEECMECKPEIEDDLLPGIPSLGTNLFNTD